MKYIFVDESWEDYLYWQKVDPKNIKRINELIKSCMRTPFEGIGKPEALKGDIQGYWSRRITSEHRLVYKVTGTKGVDQRCIILQCRFHYDD